MSPTLYFDNIPDFFDQTPRLLFLPVFMWLLFEGGYYLRAAFIYLESPQASMTAG